MPIKQAAKKALRQSYKRQSRNLTYHNKIKDLIKKARTLVVQKKINEAKALLPQIYKALDKAAKSGIIKKQKASRKKSQAAKMVNTPLKKK